MTVTGVVEDQFGPVAGANIVEKGTTNGTITDMEGKFTLEVSPKSTLVVSFIGYREQQIPVNNQTSFTIKIVEDSEALDEVVVVGYGTQKKVNLTGSISSVNFEDQALSRPVTNVSHWQVLVPVYRFSKVPVIRVVMALKSGFVVSVR